MTPDFAEFLLATPPEHRVGRVFPIDTLAGAPMNPKRVCRVISAIGKAASVVVEKDCRRPRREDDGRRSWALETKYATAHDLRRRFGARWARKVSTFELQKLMRHASIRTTEEFYVDVAIDDLAASLWQKHEPQPLRNFSPNSSELASILSNDATEKTR